MGFKPKYGDPDNTLLFKIAGILDAGGGGGGGGGVTSFNTRTGAVTLGSGDVTGALGFTPVNKAGDNVTGTFTIATNKVVLNTDGTSVFAGFMTCPFYFCSFPDAMTNTAPAVSEFYHQLTAGTVAANFGLSLDISLDTDSVARQLAARFSTIWTTAANATRTSRHRIFLLNAGTFGEVVSITPTATTFIASSVTASRFLVDSTNVNAQTGTSYQLDATDNGKVVTLDNTNPITLTVPSGLGAGFSCTIVQINTGQVSVSASGTTVNSYTSLVKLSGRHAAATLYAYVANTFNLSGNLSA
jgi:hypothetical protein